jgi:hypothetical protein
MNDKLVGRTKLGEPQVNVALLCAVLKELDYILYTLSLLIKLLFSVAVFHYDC